MSATIIEIQVENVKKIKAVQIVTKAGTVTISGRNDQGKTSVLDAIDYAFRGEKYICAEPIRAGEKRARSFVKLSEELDGVCTVERVITPGGATLVVKNKDGVTQKTPQALLDAIMAKMAFDPLSFTRLKPDAQLEMLRKLVGLDFTELNAAKALAYTERTNRNRELEAARVKMAAHEFNAALPKEPVSIQELALKLGEAKAKNQNNAQRRESVKRQEQAAYDLGEDARSLRSKLVQLEKMVEECKAQIVAKDNAHVAAKIETDRLKAELQTLSAADEGELQQQIDRIQQTNAAIETNRLHLKAKEDVELLEGTVKGLTAKIQECDDDKAAQIEFAQFPLPNLSFDEERGVLLNGVPFQQGSQARQLQAAVAIGLALNPKLRVILIRDGSLLDEDSLKLVSEICEKAQAQLWVEVVNSKDPAAIIIEDGEVKA